MARNRRERFVDGAISTVGSGLTETARTPARWLILRWTGAGYFRMSKNFRFGLDGNVGLTGARRNAAACGALSHQLSGSVAPK